jgi:hypothetical protein
LAEFHIGLIYLHWGQALGAIKYFDDALRHWQFANNDPAVSLAQFAQGICRHHAYHYEQALANYAKVQRTLNKMDANGSQPPSAFLEDLENLLSESHKDVMQKLRTLGEGEPTTFSIPVTEAGGSSAQTADDQPTREVSYEPDGDEPSASSPQLETAHRGATAPLPISNLPRALEEANATKPEITEDMSASPPPILTNSPIPQHANQSSNFIWYQVEDREDLEEFLPSIQADTALLVDTRTDFYTCTEGDLVIVDQADAEGSIPLKPQQDVSGPPFKRIYLAEVDEKLAFVRNPETGEIQFEPDHPEEIGKIKITANQSDFPIYAEEIIGIVIGIWSKLHPAQK